MTSVKWIKLVSDLFDNRKIKQIRKMPDSDAIIVIWLQILCLAGHTNDNGLVYFSKDIPYTDEMLAVEFDRPVASIRLALSVLVKFGMIEIINDILMVSNWEKYQNQGRLESIRDYHREKKRESRLRQKLLLTEMSLTGQNGPGTDIEIELEKEVEKKNIDVFVMFAMDNQELLQALKAYEAMRKSMKNKQLTQRGKELLCQRLTQLQDMGEDIIACINQSIVSNWLSVYPIKQGGQHGQSGQDHAKDQWDINNTIKL